MSDTQATPCLKEFDPKNKHHVLWLQKLDDVINKMMASSIRSAAGPAALLGPVLRTNPFGVDIPPEAFIDVHAGLSIRYASNVLAGTAWLPTRSR